MTELVLISVDRSYPSSLELYQ